MTPAFLPDYPRTFYSTIRVAESDGDHLPETAQADICIIGAGLAGLSTAFELSQRGRSVLVLEDKRVGWGASGRNGGFVNQGWSEGLGNIARRCGQQHARALFDLSVEGVDIVRRNIVDLTLPGCDPTPGKLSVTRYEAAEKLQRRRDHMAKVYGYDLDYLPREALREQLRTDIYFQALRDTGGFHFHPLNYCLGLARHVRAHGSRIVEGVAMKGFRRGGPLRWQVETAAGPVACNTIILCGGGYSGSEFGRLRRAFLPIATYVVLTEPLGQRIGDFVATADAVGDDRRSSDYYRVVDGTRLLWGGRITTRYEQDESRLARLLKQDMVQVFPGLREVGIEQAWSGLMGYARHKMPQVGALEEGLWACSSFGGHGMNTAPIAGRVVAEAVTGETDRVQLFKPYGLPWNGGPFGLPFARLTYAALRAADFWQESQSRRRAG